LESHGYATASFVSAEEFLQSERLHDTQRPISDLRMPGLSGIELQRRLIEAGHRIPTILVTAYPAPHARTAALKAGAVCILAKPVSEERLVSCLERALRGPANGDGAPSGSCGQV
jgi:FixJ family two-component response regulator